MPSRSRLLLLALSAGGLALLAQAPPAPVDWTTATDLPHIDLSGLSAPQKQKALEMLRSGDCPCGCGFKLAECRVKDPACSYSQGLAAVIVQGIKDGKSSAEIAKLAAASRWGHPPAPPKLLEDPVRIPLSGAPSQGPPNARISLVEFSDFECPYCSQASSEVRAILNAYPKDIQLFYKQFPLETHPHAQLAARASIAARNQGKFWPMHDKLFSNYRKLNRENILAWAQELGMDLPRFTADLASPASQTVVDNDLKDGLDAGVTGTPAFFINGKHYNGPFTLAALKPILDQELKSPHTARK